MEVYGLEEKKAIEELKEEINKPLEVSEDKFDTFILYNIESAKTILNLIEKIEELLQGRLFELYKYYKDLASKYQGNCVSKDKIKAKIEDIESQINDIKSNFDYEYDECMVNEVWRLENKIDVLQSLLEKE